jgi:hypothetical protein
VCAGRPGQALLAANAKARVAAAAAARGAPDALCCFPLKHGSPWLPCNSLSPTCGTSICSSSDCLSKGYACQGQDWAWWGDVGQGGAGSCGASDMCCKHANSWQLPPPTAPDPIRAHAAHACARTHPSCTRHFSSLARTHISPALSPERPSWPPPHLSPRPSPHPLHALTRSPCSPPHLPANEAAPPPPQITQPSTAPP